MAAEESFDNKSTRRPQDSITPSESESTGIDVTKGLLSQFLASELSSFISKIQTHKKNEKFMDNLKMQSI